MKRTAILPTMLAFLLLASVALANGSYDIPWWIIGAGGGPVAGGGYTLNTSGGQAAVGTASGGGYELCAGYWCGAAGPIPPPAHRIYLPMGLKSHS